MSEADVLGEQWILLGSVPQKPIYVVGGSGSSTSGPVAVEFAASATSGSTTLTWDLSPFSSPTLGFESASVAKSSPGMFYEAIATNMSGATQYLQIFNSTATPAPGSVPILSYPVGASASLSISPRNGIYFTTGISWGWSVRYDQFTGSYAGSVQIGVK